MYYRIGEVVRNSSCEKLYGSMAPIPLSQKWSLVWGWKENAVRLVLRAPFGCTLIKSYGEVILALLAPFLTRRG